MRTRNKAKMPISNYILANDDGTDAQVALTVGQWLV